MNTVRQKILLSICTVAILSGLMFFLSRFHPIFWYWDTYHNGIEVFFDGLVVISLVLAAVTYRDAKKAVDGVESASANIATANKHLDQVLKILPTRTLTAFPNHLQDICDLLNKAKVSVDIMMDCSDYGSFYAPALHLKFEESLISIAKSVKVRLLVCGTLHYFTESSPYYAKAFSDLIKDSKFLGDFSRYKEFWKDSNPRAKTKLDNIVDDPFLRSSFLEWLKKNAPKKTYSIYDFGSMTSQVFIDLLKDSKRLFVAKSLEAKDEDAFLTLLYFREYVVKTYLTDTLLACGTHSGLIRDTTASAPNFAWIIDNNSSAEGIFVIQEPGQNVSRGLGHYTINPELLRIFSEPFEQKWSSAEQLDAQHIDDMRHGG